MNKPNEDLVHEMPRPVKTHMESATDAFEMFLPGNCFTTGDLKSAIDRRILQDTGKRVCNKTLDELTGHLLTCAKCWGIVKKVASENRSRGVWRRVV